MKTQFVKNKENKRFVINQDAEAFGTGTVRKLKGYNKTYFASCSVSYGDTQSIELYDSETLKILCEFEGKISDITKETQFGLDVIEFVKSREM